MKRRYALITGLGFAFTDGDASTKRRIAQTIDSALYALALRLATGVFFQNSDDAALFRERKLIPCVSRPLSSMALASTSTLSP